MRPVSNARECTRSSCANIGVYINCKSDNKTKQNSMSNEQFRRKKKFSKGNCRKPIKLSKFNGHPLIASIYRV